jgi:peptidoglycan/LPS O-acetylase OafA/YrhL
VFFVEALLFGSIAFQFNLHGIIQARVPPRALPGIACALLLFILIFPSFAHDGTHWLIEYVLAIGACVLLVNISAAQLNSPCNLVVLRWLGARSYSLYVLHFQFLAMGGLVGQMLGLNFSSPRAYDFVLILFLFLGLPVLEFVHKCIEMPLVAYSKRCFKQIGSTPITS